MKYDDRLRIFYWLRDHVNEWVRARDISAELRVDRQTITRLFREFERDGLMESKGLTHAKIWKYKGSTFRQL